MAVMTCRGIVKGNIVVLEDAAILPEGSEVEVRLLELNPIWQEGGQQGQSLEH